jgi:hypothetical protein
MAAGAGGGGQANICPPTHIKQGRKRKKRRDTMPNMETVQKVFLYPQKVLERKQFRYLVTTRENQSRTREEIESSLNSRNAPC